MNLKIWNTTSEAQLAVCNEAAIKVANEQNKIEDSDESTYIRNSADSVRLKYKKYCRPELPCHNN